MEFSLPDGRIIRDINAVPDELNREVVFVTFEDPDGTLTAELMHPVDATELLQQFEVEQLAATFEQHANMRR